MKKYHLRHLMVTGMTAGLLCSSQALKGDEPKVESSAFLKLIASTNGNIASSPLTEEELLLELNQQGAETYQQLSPEGKALALKLASRGCNGMNDCKGENACADDKHDCAGKGDCKGKTKCAFSEKNLAVKIAAKLMAEKRQELQNQDPQKTDTDSKQPDILQKKS